MVVFPGINGDTDVVRALKMSGFTSVEKVWFSQDLPKTDLVVIPGGFSYGDYLRPGAIAAFTPVMDSIRGQSKKGVPVLGICNGFQILIEAGLLRGSLLSNKNIMFASKWIDVTVENSETTFTKGYGTGQEIKLPCAHCSGMYFAKPEELRMLEDTGCVVFRYSNWSGDDEGCNFNGSQNGIAGIVNEKGNVMGLMPHPERAVEDLMGSSSGLALFKSIFGMSWRIHAQEIGISLEECDRLEQLLGRIPNSVEVEMVGAMWSEHCSYKSSKHFLKQLPIRSKTDPDRVVCSLGENAGAVSIGDGQVLVFKVESHNHPSYVDPEQGSATGVGGILRDIFTMGARPVALMNALFFGAWNHTKTSHLVKGVAKGIGGYGNSVGIPTVGGVTLFHGGYEKNILVNAMALGVTEKLFYSKGEGVGNLLVYAGNLTGTDGVHGARMSSSPLEETMGRDPIQVADPFVGKAMMESCLELLEKGGVVALQDMGAAGITCSSVEVASKGGLGVEVDLDQVPQRGGVELSSEDMLLSESQERMLFVMKPSDLPFAQKVFDKWGVYHAVLGKLTRDELVVVKHGGIVVAEMPVKIMTEQAPTHHRERRALPPLHPVDVVPSGGLESLEECMVKLLSSENFCSKDWIYQQYDQTVGGNTIRSNSSNLAVVRVEVDGKPGKAIATSLNCTFSYCRTDPRKGAAISVAECYRHLISTGARPLAITNCLNFADPRVPEIMEQFALVVDGMKEACEKLDFPVVSGNVSFYNQTGDTGIFPTPVIGGVGLINPISRMLQSSLQGGTLILVGATKGHLQRSAYAEYILGEGGGLVPDIDLSTEKKVGEFVLHQATGIKSCSPVGQCGAVMAIFKACIENRMGVKLELPKAINPIAFLFGEDQSRYLVETDKPEEFLAAAAGASVPALRLGDVIQRFELQVEDITLNLDRLLKFYLNAMPHHFNDNC